VARVVLGVVCTALAHMMWTVGGGALIVAAGLLVIVCGEREAPPASLEPAT